MPPALSCATRADGKSPRAVAAALGELTVKGGPAARMRVLYEALFAKAAAGAKLTPLLLERVAYLKAAAAVRESMGGCRRGRAACRRQTVCEAGLRAFVGAAARVARLMRPPLSSPPTVCAGPREPAVAAGGAGAPAGRDAAGAWRRGAQGAAGAVRG